MGGLIKTLALSTALTITPQVSLGYNRDTNTNTSIYDLLNPKTISSSQKQSARGKFDQIFNTFCDDLDMEFHPIINTTIQKVYLCMGSSDTVIPNGYQKGNISNCMWITETGMIGCNMKLEDETTLMCVLVDSFWEKLEGIIENRCENL